MPKTCTIDASVFVNAFNPAEAGHADSFRVLETLQTKATPIIVPTLLLAEVAAAIKRGRGDEGVARQFVAALSQLSHLVWVTLDTGLAQEAADIAAQYNLRGSDAVYVAVAYRFGADLITLDKEQHDRVKILLNTWYPIDFE